MKRAAVAGVALLGVAVVGLVGWLVLLRPPTVVIANVAGSPATGVHVQTDVGESYAIGTIAASASVRLQVSGRDQAVWIVAQLPNGEVKESERIYLTSGLDLNCAITGAAVICTYAT